MKTARYLVIALLLLSGAAQADSLFNQLGDQGASLVSDKKNRFEVGDIITVLVREQVDASTASDLNTKKESKIDTSAPVADNSFLMKDDKIKGGLGILSQGDLPNIGVNSKNEAKNRGTTNRKSSLETSITCFVSEVQPNGNIKLEGTKQVTVNREDSVVSVSGIARPKDVTAENTIQSTQIANVVVSLKGKGPLWNNERRGLLTKVLDWFSPF